MTYRSASASPITEGQNENCSDQTSNLIDRRDKALIDRIVLRAWKVIIERISRNDAAHDTLVISEKKKSRSCNGRDEQTKWPAVETCIGPYCGNTSCSTRRHDMKKSQISISGPASMDRNTVAWWEMCKMFEKLGES